MGNSNVTVYAHWELKPFSGEWSGWSYSPVSGDEYTMVQTRNVYEYPVYRAYIYGESFIVLNSSTLYVLAREGARSTADTVCDILTYNDPFGLGDLSGSRRFVGEINGLNSIDGNIYLITDYLTVLEKYASEDDNTVININGYDWRLGVVDGQLRKQYRYQKRIN